MRVSSIILLTAVGVFAAGPARPALLLNAIWDPETTLTAPTYTSETDGAPGGQKVAVSRNRQIHVLFHSNRGGVVPQTWYKCFDPVYGWTPETCISSDVAQLQPAATPTVAVDPQGNVHVAWGPREGVQEIRYKMRTAAGVWDSISTLLSTESERIKGNPTIACTPDSHVHVVWRQLRPEGGTLLVYREKAGSEWSRPCTVEFVDSFASINAPCISPSPDNSVHLVWHGPVPNGPYRSQVYYRCRTGSFWGPREQVSVGSDSFDQSVATVAVDPTTGEPHAAWGGATDASGSRRLFHTRRTQGAWLTRDTVSEPGASRQNSPSLCFTPDGVGHVVWRGSDETAYSIIRYSERNPSGQWHLPVDLTPLPASRSWAVMNNGGSSVDSNHVYVVWTDSRSGTRRVYFRHGAPSPQGIEWDEQTHLNTVSIPGLQVFGQGRVAYVVGQAGMVQLGIYDASGRLVKPLVNRNQPPGTYKTFWDGTDVSGRRTAAGVYFCRLVAPGTQMVKKTAAVK
ncbi:MAG: FlgD immunoglobulin-like domain containing protein [candidate division WOR-3 bacterium]